MYSAVIHTISNLSPHLNADKLQIATIYNNSVIVSIDVKVGDKGIFFPTGVQLSEEFAKYNNLVCIRDSSGNRIGGGFFEENRVVKTTKLRGEKSEGFWVPLSSLGYITQNFSLKEGEAFTNIGEHLICSKYLGITANNNHKDRTNSSVKDGTKYLTFKEHYDTDNIKYKLDKFITGDVVTITSKLHGTSFRCSNSLVETTIKRELSIWEKLKQKLGSYVPNTTKCLAWTYVSGSRRQILTSIKETIRLTAHNFFRGKLHKGETIYGEIVGYEQNTPIMKHIVKDKELIKLYGNSVSYSYGCPVGECDFYIYRITLTNEDGYVIEYSWDQIKRRASELNAKVVPELGQYLVRCSEGKLYLKSLTDLNTEVELFTYLNSFDGPDTLDSSHPCEGFCIRNERTGRAYKHKLFGFLTLEDGSREKIIDKEELS